MAINHAAVRHPARVHERAFELSGHRPFWRQEIYSGGLFCREHFRICSYCRCIHPIDLIDLLRAGRSRLERGDKPGKHILITPNPIAGTLGRMGSFPGPVFEKDCWPSDLSGHLSFAARADLEFEPEIGERLGGHYERPSLAIAPELIAQPFYSEHSNEPQWAEIEAAAEGA